MRVALLEAPGTLNLIERERPALLPGMARVRVRRAGLCGTDLAIASGAYAVPLPLVLGHEWCGEVIEVAHTRDEAWLGARVVGEINNHCQALSLTPCPLCEASLSNHCAERTVTGIVSADGAFADELVIPVHVLHRVPDALSDDEAVFVEPYAAALQTFELSPLSPGDWVVVLGSGRLGTLIAAAALRLHARVLAVSRSGKRDALLQSLGAETLQWDFSTREAPADPLAPATSPLLSAVLERTGGRGAPIVVEATGSPLGLAAALDGVQPRGTIALKSTPGQPVRELNLTRMVVNEVRLQGSRCGPFDRALEHLVQHPLPTQGLVGATYRLDAIEEAFEAAESLLKVLVAP